MHEPKTTISAQDEKSQGFGVFPINQMLEVDHEASNAQLPQHPHTHNSLSWEGPFSWKVHTGDESLNANL